MTQQFFTGNNTKMDLSTLFSPVLVLYAIMRNITYINQFASRDHTWSDKSTECNIIRNISIGDIIVPNSSQFSIIAEYISYCIIP